MKNIILALLLAYLCTSGVFAQSQNYINGYQIGYKEGFCYDKKQDCIEPIEPLTPIPEINEDFTSYKDGYQRGFIDGQTMKSRKTRSYTNSSKDKYAPANFGTYTKPINIDLVNYVMSQKQKKADRQKTIQYQKVLGEAISSNSQLYDMVMGYLTKHYYLFNWAEQYQKDFERLYEPSKIVSNYSEQITIAQASALINDLQQNYDAMAEGYKTIANYIKEFSEHPNNIVNGYYEVTSVMDFEYDYDKGGYVEVNSNVSQGKGNAYLNFSQNRIAFKRPDSEMSLQCALRYDKLEDGYYKFYDGFGQTIWITKDNVFLQYYHTPDENGNYMKKTSYLVMGGFNFNEINRVK